MRKFLATLSLVIVIPTLGVGQAVAATVNKSCSKAGLTSGAGAMKLTCKKVGGTLKWVLTPTTKASPSATAAKVGTFSSPVPAGTFTQVGDFSYRIDSSSNDVTSQVCALSGFDTGCTYNENLDRIVDPKATGRWITLTITSINKGKDIARPDGYTKSFALVLPNGKLSTSANTSLEEELSSTSLIPAGQATGVVAFYLDKSIAIPDLLVIRDLSSFLSSETIYFKIPK